MNEDVLNPGCSDTSETEMREVLQGLPVKRDLLAMAEFFKTFGDQTRLSLLHALHGTELCVQDLATLLEMSESAVSHQLGMLRRAGLIKPRRDGKNVYYSLDDHHVAIILETAREHLGETERN